MANEEVREPILVIDATGVGKAAGDLFRRGGLTPYVVMITASDKVEEEYPVYRVPKRDVISSAVVLLQTGRLKIAKDLPHGQLLTRELQSFRIGDVPHWDSGGHRDDIEWLP